MYERWRQNTLSDELLKQLYKKYISLKKILYLFESIVHTMIHV